MPAWQDYTALSGSPAEPDTFLVLDVDDTPPAAGTVHQVTAVTTAAAMAGMMGAVPAAAAGVVGDGSTDCTTAMQDAAYFALQATQQGTAIVDLPPGTIVISGTVECSSATSSAAGLGVVWRGHSAGTRIFKASSFGPALAWTGYGGPGGFPSVYGGMLDVDVEGNATTGGLVSLASAQQMFFRGCRFTGSADTALVLDTVQDSYWSQCTWNTNGTTAAPVISIYGSAGGTSNMLWFSQVRIEDFPNGAVWIKQGIGNTGGNNGFFFDECKFETGRVNGDLFYADSYTQQLVMSKVFLAADAFNGGYGTPPNGITFGNGASGPGNNQASFRDVWMHSGISANSVINIVGTGMTGPVTVDSVDLDFSPASAVVATSGTMSGLTLEQRNVDGQDALGGPQTLAAGTASAPPQKFQSGPLTATAAAGAGEFDGTAFYATAAAGSRQVIPAEQFTCLASSYTLANSTSAQQLFNATSAGALTVQGSTSYWVDAEFDLAGLSSSSHTVEFGFGGTATFTSLKYVATANAGAAGTLASWQTAVITTASATALMAAGTTTTFQARIRGILRVSAGGTLIPQVTQLTASAAAVVGANSWIRLAAVGSNTVADVGDWS